MTSETVGLALRDEMLRVRLLLAVRHKDNTSAGVFPMIHLEQLLREAEQALLSGSLIEMQRLTSELKGCE